MASKPLRGRGGSSESAERMRSIMDHVIDGIITIDARGIVATFNPAAERIFGYQAAEVIGRNVKMLMPEPYHGGEWTAMRRAARFAAPPPARGRSSSR